MSTRIPPPHEILVIKNKYNSAKPCFDVRMDVFHVEQKFPEETELDEYDSENSPHVAHILLRLTGSSQTPVGTIRGVKLGPGSYKLSRLAVLKEFRHYKFGRLLVDAFHNWVIEDAASDTAVGTAQIVCSSQLPVIPFYARFGYTPEGEEYDDEGQPHKRLVLQLPVKGQ